jgi:hypothetical protein
VGCVFAHGPALMEGVTLSQNQQPFQVADESRLTGYLQTLAEHTRMCARICVSWRPRLFPPT